jgi:ATP-dependent DNA ligase
MRAELHRQNVFLYAFDLTELNGDDLRRAEGQQRRQPSRNESLLNSRGGDYAD